MIPDIGNFSSIIGNSIPQKECVESFHEAKKRRGGEEKKKKKSKRRKRKNGEKERNVSSRYGSLKLCFFPA